MILIIDTTDRKLIKLGLATENIEWFEKETERQSEDLLIELDRILKQKKLKLSSFSAILVNIGPGSFTGVRVGVTVANTLSWSLNIPAVGYKNNKLKTALDTSTSSVSTLSKIEGVDKFKKTKKTKFSKSVLPYYA